MATPESELPTWSEAQQHAVTHASAAATERDPATREHHLQLAQVWATIALSRATFEQAQKFAHSVDDLTGTINDIPSRLPR
ncbi:hypothetical protein GCM10009853_024510 [Glycomyces scopariae]|uniref:Uncharacterized protein n=1 Tax=Glycomyces sambucus TaxID=380244 RepID=A0A1G9M8A7_9ACTN|nr:hypothetical protein [Glycomyces sambucus]SDL70181.1 hypothetical protein SAMN05216298_4901 [Glycomyces sambucus]